MPTPIELNLLTNVQFKFDIYNLPNTTFFIQDFTVPAITLDSPVFPGMRRDVPMPGTKAVFDQLTFSFLVDEDLNNYYEMYSWLMDIQRSEDMRRQKSDGVLHLLTGQMNVNRQIRFVGLVPTMLSELSLSSGDTDNVRVECTTSFAYEYFDFVKVDERAGTDKPLTFNIPVTRSVPNAN